MALRKEHLCMLKIKKAIAVITLFLLTVSLGQGNSAMGSENGDLYLNPEKQGSIKSYQTTEVFIGDLNNEAQAVASVQYPNYKGVFFSLSNGEATFEGFLVNQGDYVEEGAPIAKVSTRINDIQVEELKLNLKRLEQNYSDYCYNKEQTLFYLMEDINKADQPIDIEKKTLIYEKNLLEYEQGKMSKEKEIAELREEVKDQEESSEAEFIYASSSGIIDGFSRIWTGTNLSDGEYLATIFDTSKVLLAVKNSGKILKYNMPVSILAKNKDKTLELTGRVISFSSDILSTELISETAYIEINEDTTGFVWSNNNTVIYQPLTMKNVLLVSVNAVGVEGTKTYVTEYVDNQLYKRYFIAGRFNTRHYWVLDGLKEGMEVIID